MLTGYGPTPFRSIQNKLESLISRPSVDLVYIPLIHIVKIHLFILNYCYQSCRKYFNLIFWTLLPKGYSARGSAVPHTLTMELRDVITFVTGNYTVVSSQHLHIETFISYIETAWGRNVPNHCVGCGDAGWHGLKEVLETVWLWRMNARWRFMMGVCIWSYMNSIEAPISFGIRYSFVFFRSAYYSYVRRDR